MLRPPRLCVYLTLTTIYPDRNLRTRLWLITDVRLLTSTNWELGLKRWKEDRDA
jgi:hypothetical protein